MTYPAYPHEVVRIMGREMASIKRTVGHHFSKRHDGTRAERSARKTATQHWIAAYRKTDNASAYSKALAMIAKPEF